MTIPPQSPAEGKEQSSQLSFPDPAGVVDKFLNEVSHNPAVENCRQILLERRAPGFKPTVKYLDTISALHNLDPQSSEALFCLEINRLKEPKVYGKAQRARLLFQASRYAISPNSPLTTLLASDSEIFAQILQIENLSPAVAEQLSNLRPPEEQEAIAEKIAKNFLGSYSIYLLQKPFPENYAAVFLRRLFGYFDRFSDSKKVGQVLEAVKRISPLASDRLIKLITYFANLENHLTVSAPGLRGEKYEIGTIFANDMSFLQAYTGSLKVEERRELAKSAVDLSTKFPDLSKLTEEIKVARVTELTQTNVSKALEKVSRYTEAVAEANEALDNAQLMDFEFHVSFYKYDSPATYDAIGFPNSNRRLCLNNLSQILTYNGGWSLTPYDAPPELKKDVELLHKKYQTVSTRLQNEMAERFEKAIPAIVAKAQQSLMPLPADDYQSVKNKLKELTSCLESMDNPYYWSDKIFPAQFEKLLIAIKAAAEQTKKALIATLPEKQKLLKQKKLHEAELAYREKLIRSRIVFLLTKYGIAADLPLDEINVSVYTSEKDDLIYDHVFNRSSIGQSSSLNYEIGRDPEFTKLKEKAIDLIIPHEIGHLVIDENIQCDKFLNKKSDQFAAVQEGLDERQRDLLRRNLTECVVDGVGFGFSLALGGTNTHPGQNAEILIELSKAFANLEKVLELQGDRDNFSKLMNRLRMSANVEFLLAEAEKFQVAEEFTNGFHQGKMKYAETIQTSNQQISTPLSNQDLDQLKRLMRQAIEFGRQIEHVPDLSDD